MIVSYSVEKKLKSGIKVQQLLEKYENASGKCLNKDKTNVFFSSNTT